ncbi:MAG TPA: FG-GAP-like repeat-containing protein [Thermoanaerobaculia bacterium]|nr:FG-GAP-like repeat-containing protein [Thermoanaerobaculia bacterium]
MKLPAAATLFFCLAISALPAAAVCTFNLATPPARASAGERPGDVAAGDFNNDGYLDIAAVNRQTNGVSILLGKADGSFGTPKTVDLGQYTQDDIATANLNNDGNLDLIVSVPWSENFTKQPRLKILLGLGDGTFLVRDSPVIFQNPGQFVVEDFNHDGKQDVATTKVNGFELLTGDGFGHLTERTSMDLNPPNTGSSPTDIAAGDFDADGNLDVAVVEFTTDRAHIFWGVGDGSFTVGPLLVAGSGGNDIFVSLAAGDFNGDGRADLALANRDPHNLSIYLAGASRTFSGPAHYGTLDWTSDAIASDLDGDGDLDVVLAAGVGVEFFPNNGDGTFGAQRSFGSALSIGVILGDVDRDGGPDVIISDFNNNQVAIFRNSCGRVSLSLTSSANPVSQGTNVTLTTTAVAPPAVTPTGTIAMAHASTPLGMADLAVTNTVSATLSDLAPGSYVITATYSGDDRFLPTTRTLTQVVQVPPFGPPPKLNAISVGGPVALAWIGTSGVDHYEIWRSNGAGYVLIGTSSGAQFTDNTAPATSALLYKVRGISPANAASGFSLPDLALTYAFTDETLTPATTVVKLVHLTELRGAVNAARAVLGMGPISWGEPSPTLINAGPWGELRSAVDGVRGALGLPAASFTDAMSAGLLIRGVHVAEVRSALR